MNTTLIEKSIIRLDNNIKSNRAKIMVANKSLDNLFKENKYFIEKINLKKDYEKSFRNCLKNQTISLNNKLKFDKNEKINVNFLNYEKKLKDLEKQKRLLVKMNKYLEIEKIEREIKKLKHQYEQDKYYKLKDNISLKNFNWNKKNKKCVEILKGKFDSKINNQTIFWNRNYNLNKKKIKNKIFNR